jgi:hypothetical protein
MPDSRARRRWSSSCPYPVRATSNAVEAFRPLEGRMAPPTMPGEGGPRKRKGTVTSLREADEPIRPAPFRVRPGADTLFRWDDFKAVDFQHNKVTFHRVVMEQAARPAPAKPLGRPRRPRDAPSRGSRPRSAGSRPSKSSPTLRRDRQGAKRPPPPYRSRPEDLPCGLSTARPVRELLADLRNSADQLLLRAARVHWEAPAT